MTSQGNDGFDQPVVFIADFDPGWLLRFAELGSRLRQALGPTALRIDHIGSTSVPGLAAKPVIDVQVTVDRLEPVVSFRVPLENLGFIYRAGNTDRTKRYFRNRQDSCGPTSTSGKPAASRSSSRSCSATSYASTAKPPRIMRP